MGRAANRKWIKRAARTLDGSWPPKAGAPGKAPIFTNVRKGERTNGQREMARRRKQSGKFETTP